MQQKVDTELQSYYNEQYASNDKAWRTFGAIQKVKNILDISKGMKFAKVLEVGAGDGSILELLASQAFASQLYALEISNSGIEKIEAKRIDKFVEVLKFDGYQIPYPDKSFDLVILSHVLEHVEHERILLREIKRVSKFQIIEVPKDYRFGVDKKIKHFLDYGHINIYTPSSLKFLLKSEGFEVLQELDRIYGKEVYFFNQKNFAQKIKAYLIFFSKILLTSTPIAYINHKFINSITLLTKS